MASGSASKAYHSTLVGDEPDTVDLVPWTRYVLVINRGSDPIYATTDGTTATVKGDDTFCVPPGESKVLFNHLPVEYPQEQNYSEDFQDFWVTGTRVSLISAGGPDYSVERN